MDADGPLRGLTLVVTRPRVQAAATARVLRDAGANVTEFPVLDIAPVDVAFALDNLDCVTDIIFVSANAVAYGIPALQRIGEIGATFQLLAIGRATAAALADAGFKHVVSPQQSIDSEGLLALPELHAVEGRHVIVVKGVSESGGRTLLDETLTARGARVSVLECYRRAPRVPEPAVQDALRSSLATGCVHGCFALSVETVDSLANIFPAMKLPAQAQIVLLVPHLRVANAARKRGFDRVAEAPMAEAALISRLVELKPQLLYPSGAPVTL